MTFQPGGSAIADKVFITFGSLSTFITTQSGVENWTILIDGSTSGKPCHRVRIISATTFGGFHGISGQRVCEWLSYTCPETMSPLLEQLQCRLPTCLLFKSIT